MNRQSITAYLVLLLLILCACSTHHRADGWYPIADYPNNSIVGISLATIKDFKDVVIVRDTLFIDKDTVSRIMIQGRVKPEKRQQWADSTEQLIGKRLGFVYDDSIITGPQINARIESGRFQIISSDSIMLKRIYQTITQKINLSAQQAVARERMHDGTTQRRAAALLDALTNPRYSVAESGQGLAAEVWVPLSMRFVDMKRHGNWKIYNRQVWGLLYGDTLQSVKYEFRDWLSKNYPEMLRKAQ